MRIRGRESFTFFLWVLRREQWEKRVLGIAPSVGFYLVANWFGVQYHIAFSSDHGTSEWNGNERGSGETGGGPFNRPGPPPRVAPSGWLISAEEECRR